MGIWITLHQFLYSQMQSTLAQRIGMQAICQMAHGTYGEYPLTLRACRNILAKRIIDLIRIYHGPFKTVSRQLVAICNNHTGLPVSIDECCAQSYNHPTFSVIEL